MTKVNRDKIGEEVEQEPDVDEIEEEQEEPGRGRAC